VDPVPGPHGPADVVARVAGLAARSRAATETVWVGIDGRGAAGKTSLAAAVAATVGAAGHTVQVVHVDDFSGPHVDTWDRDRFRRQVLEPLLAGLPARYQARDWHTDSGGPWIDLAAGGVVVVEGVSATTAAVPVPWALRVWVDAPLDVRLARALARDGEERMSLWADRWLPSEEAYVAAERPDLRADLVVDGTQPPG
jgi:uridine kinase